jgi:subtilisin family serine protease
MKHRKPKSRPTFGRLVAGILMAPPLLVAAALSATSSANAQQAEPQGHVAANTSRPLYSTTRVLVKFDRGLTASAQARLARVNDATVVGHVRELGVTVLKVPAGAASHVATALERSGKVVYAEADGTAQVAGMTTNDTYWSSQSADANYAHIPDAWTSSTGSANVTVAVLDSGVTYGLPDLSKNLVSGYDFVSNDADATDPGSPSHGTEVAGIIGADTNNGTGVAGVCWSCSVMPVRVCDTSGSCSWSAVASGLTWAADHGARVVNMSFSGTASSSTLASAVTYAQQHGVLLVAAAGNSGCNCPTYPASLPGVISVAAVTTTGALQSYSNYGQWVDLAATANDWTTWSNGSYQPMGGTSASTPIVAGVAALAFSAAPSSSADAVATALQSSAQSISNVSWGAVNAAGAVQALTGGAPSTSPSPSPSPTSTTTSPSPSPSPTATAPAPGPTATASTQTFSGTLTKATSASYGVSCATSSLSAQVTFKKASSMTLSATSGGAPVGSSSGASPVRLSGAVSGSAVVTVGGPLKTSYTVTVTC